MSMERNKFVHNAELKIVKAKGGFEIQGFANKAVVDDVGDLMTFGEGAIDFSRFDKNPIMFFNHNRDQPIGVWVDRDQRHDGLIVKGRLSKSDHVDIKKIRDLVEEGILNSLSIGYDEIDSYKDARGVNVVTKWKLNEVSIVTMPANVDSTFSIVKAKELTQRILDAGTLEDARAIFNEVPIVNTEIQSPVVSPEEKQQKDFQECVSAKIPKLLEEGKTQEQAVAIAMEMCGEENGKCTFSLGDVKFALEMFSPPLANTNVEPPVVPVEAPIEPPVETTPVPKSSDNPSDFGSPFMDIAKSQLALMGQISTQLGALSETMEKLVTLAIPKPVGDNEIEPQDNSDRYTLDEVSELLSIATSVKEITKSYI